MSSIDNLPLEIQNKIFYYYAEHPCAKMIKNQIAILTKHQIWPNHVSDSIRCRLFISNTRYFHHYHACFRRTGIVKRWSSILHSIDDKIVYHSKPIHITKLLKSMSYPILTDIEKTWVMNRFKIINYRKVLL